MPLETGLAKFSPGVIYFHETVTFVSIRDAMIQWIKLLQAGLQEWPLEKVPMTPVLSEQIVTASFGSLPGLANI